MHENMLHSTIKEMENITSNKIQLILLVTDTPKIKWHRIVEKNRMPQVIRQNKIDVELLKSKKKSLSKCICASEVSMKSLSKWTKIPNDMNPKYLCILHP